MDREAIRNGYLYAKFRDQQFALYDEFAKKNGILMNTLLVCNVLYYAKAGMTQHDICERTFLSKQTVNLNIKKLMKDGYVISENMPDNRKNKMISMTDKGRDYCGKVVSHIIWAENQAMSMFSSEEQNQLIDLSRTFTKNLEQLIKQDNEEG